MVSQLRGAGIDVVWFSSQPESDQHYRDLEDFFFERGQQVGNILIAEHAVPDLLLGHNGYLDFETINAINPEVRIGVICGNVDTEGLRSSGLTYAPEQIAPFGHMSYQPYVLGPRPVQMLYTAGLKVGEVMARARLAGMSVREAAAFALKNSPAMDFKGELSWL